MEEQGMGRRRRGSGTGLLKMKKFRITMPIFILLRIISVSGAQAAFGPVVEVKTSPAVPAAGSPWVLTLLIDHPVPGEVTVTAPPFTDALFLDHFLKSPFPAETRQWTAAEYHFMPKSAGITALDSFTIITPRGKTLTAPITVNVRRPGGGQEAPRPKFSWEGVPSRLAPGESAVFSLRVSGLVSPPEISVPAVPPGVILESLALPDAEKAAGLALRLRLIPLKADSFDLPGRLISRTGDVFEAPPLHITIGAVSGVSSANIAGDIESQSAPAAGPGKAPAPFPAFDLQSRLPKKFRAEHEAVYGTAGNLWERGYHAEALAELRRHERDHPAGSALAPIRREAERNLGLFNTADESRRPGKLFLLAVPVCFALAGAAVLLCFRAGSASLVKKAALVCAIFLFAGGIFCVYRLLDSGGGAAGLKGGPAGHPRFGITKETVVRRIPDSAGEAIFHFAEGQPVRLSGFGEKASPDGNGVWVWAETNDAQGAAGWIPGGKIIFY
jgi:hypothetical protein